MKKNLMSSILRNQRGAVAVIVGISIFMLVGFGALAVDIGHLHVARNELQNAADAGALAGARVLYNDDGTAVNTGANQEAYDAATANKSEGTAVEVNWSGGNDGDVQRGHWSFGLAGLERGFYPNASTTPVDLWNVSTADLDANLNFINAVRVVTRRTTQGTPVASFFARIFGHENFELSAEAVGYIGFAGTLMPGDVDQPIAICSDTLLNDSGEYTCNIGRMINSGVDAETNETGGWTSFDQTDDPCSGGTNSVEIKSLVCSDGNPEELMLGEPMETTGGEVQVAFDALRACWDSETGTTQLWPLTLPVIDCGDENNVGTCEEIVGAVELNIVWITGGGEDPLYKDAPTQMDEWSNSDPDGVARWNDFVTYFNLVNADGTPAPYAKKSIYFLPDCTPHEPKGVSGGENFGILAKIPVLVQ
ncbi:MAG: pilus assembly protein TadG-related protein [Deltaproteobacteria bacterium]|jgi:Flp pilus assembly protein TadG|nr:pilus assembly protein TadG-related protein [Deltaproteobacteria bacterium]